MAKNNFVLSEKMQKVKIKGHDLPESLVYFHEDIKEFVKIVLKKGMIAEEKYGEFLKLLGEKLR